MQRILIAYFLATLALFASAQSSYWRDEQGRPLPDTAARKSSEGFAGWLLITPDENWKEKWETPSSTVPNFNEAKKVARGKKIFTLIFFANPSLDGAGMANVACDLKATRPDGSSSIDARDVPCFQGKIRGEPMNLYLSAPVVEFVGEPTDQSGIWRIEVTLKDNNRGATLALATSFQLQ